MHIERVPGTINVMRGSRYKGKKSKIISLRKEGKSYGEIRKILGIDIPKSTLSNWCTGVSLPRRYQQHIQKLISKGGHKGRATAWALNRARRERYLQQIEKRNSNLGELLYDKNVAKIALAMLYLGEGGKNLRGSLMFGNSDPLIIGLFLQLLRRCYAIDETKFRCTLQCRADQNTKKLERFWRKITKIPRSQFYKARIDPRTIGKPSRKLDYRGVCRIDYFSAEIFLELMQIPEILYKGPLAQR